MDSTTSSLTNQASSTYSFNEFRRQLQERKQITSIVKPVESIKCDLKRIQKQLITAKRMLAIDLERKEEESKLRAGMPRESKHESSIRASSSSNPSSLESSSSTIPSLTNPTGSFHQLGTIDYVEGDESVHGTANPFASEYEDKLREELDALMTSIKSKVSEYAHFFASKSYVRMKDETYVCFFSLYNY